MECVGSRARGALGQSTPIVGVHCEGSRRVFAPNCITNHFVDDICNQLPAKEMTFEITG
jgi:hypothetical protein